MEFTVDGVKVITDLDVDEVEARKYIDYVNDNKPEFEPLKSIEVKPCEDGKVDVDYTLQGEKFERIRRITGKKIAVCC